MAQFKDILINSIQKLDEWITNNHWKAYDPFDGLNSVFLKPLTFDNHYLRIVAQQSVRRFPINLRPLLGIKKETSSKGMGFCALGYCNLYKATGKEEYFEKMKFCLDWLKANYCKNYSGYSWGNHFTYEARGGRIPLGIPTIVWTSLIANIFLDAFEAFGERDYFAVAEGACIFILKDIHRYTDQDGDICFMYTPLNTGHFNDMEGHIHNANVLGAWLLGRIYQHTGKKSLLTLAKKAINFTVKDQTSYGGWYYGVENKYKWIDNFHTGYVLESLHGYIKATGDESYTENLAQGYNYFKTVFFKDDGTPKYYNRKTYPIDIQCLSQGIQTLVRLREFDHASVQLAQRVAAWAINNMQDPDGYFYFRKYPFITNKTPMFHWGQATMLAGLSHLVKVL